MGLPADIERYRETYKEWGGETYCMLGRKGEERLITIDAIQCPNKRIGTIT